MQTESILSILEGIFNKREGFSKKELESVNTLTISRVSLDKEVLSVNFSDLLNFPNLENLTVDSCTLDTNVMKIFDQLPNLIDISFYDCEVVEDIYPYLENIQMRNLIISNSNFKVEMLNGYYETLTLEGFNISNINCFGITLDIYASNLENVNFLMGYNFEEYVISRAQYNRYTDEFNNAERRVVVMEDNGQFIYKKVGF